MKFLLPSPFPALLQSNTLPNQCCLQEADSYGLSGILVWALEEAQVSEPGETLGLGPTS